MAVAILMPAFNEVSVLAETLTTICASAPALGGITVFLVDDGSEHPIVASALPAPTPAFSVVLARHGVNLGQGAALETARRLALSWAEPEAFDAYVTMDADGQHRIEDLRALVDALASGADVALGSRFRGRSNVPTVRRMVLFAARLFERIITGLSLSDAHNGYRAFTRRALERVQIRENRMAHATELTMQISRAAQSPKPNDLAKAESSPRLRVVEVPVSIRYTDYSRGKGQASLGAFTILRDLFYRYLFEGPR